MVPLPAIPGEQTPQTIAELVRYIYMLSAGVVALAACVMLLYAGFKYFSSAGNPSRAADARDQIQHALLGLMIVAGSYLILNTINPKLVDFVGFCNVIISPLFHRLNGYLF